jgi:hypothetical protein
MRKGYSERHILNLQKKLLVLIPVQFYNHTLLVTPRRLGMIK